MKLSFSHPRLLPSETRQLRPLTLWLPLGLLIAYLLGMILVPEVPWLSPLAHGRHQCLVHSELGIIENASALMFLASAILALRLAWKLRRRVRRIYVAAYLVFAIAAMVVCLEEINYGQFFLRFETPELVREHSTQFRPAIPDDDATEEASDAMEDLAFNLHNLAGNKPARRLNTVATFGFPTWCILLPLVVARFWPRQAWNQGNWTRYLLPGLQLTVIVIIAQAFSWLDDGYVALLQLSESWNGQVEAGAVLSAPQNWLDSMLDHLKRYDNHWYRASEFKELYWSLGGVVYMLVLSRRLLPEKSDPPSRPELKETRLKQSAAFSACL